MEIIAQHGIETAVVVTNALVAHVTWRTLPDAHRHYVRKAVRRVVRRGMSG
jgi:hypothetical protein